MTTPGRLVAGRYRLREQIGGGGMGAVWLARDERLGRDIAIKQVLPPVGTDPKAAQQQKDRALREGRIAARLSHPHAISVYDVALEDDQPWLVMEYLPSRSLSEVLSEDGVLRVDQAAQIGAQVADALAATHAAGIVHRDVKPSNILIGRGGRIEGLVKITDFGISHASGDVTLTQTGQITGTPAFLAPEVAQGIEPGPAADVFSLGATIYTCLEGEPPFGMGDNALQQLHRVAAGKINPPRHSGILTRPLMRMLSADPAGRPTMDEVRDELATLAAGRDGDTTTVLAARTDLTSPNRTVPSRPPTAHFTGAAGVAAVAAAAEASRAASAAEAPATPAAAKAPAPAPPTPPPAPATTPRPAGTRTPPPTPAHPTSVTPSVAAEPERRGRRVPPLAWASAAVVALLVGLILFWTLVLDTDPGADNASPDSDPTPTSEAPADGTGEQPTGNGTGDGTGEEPDAGTGDGDGDGDSSGQGDGDTTIEADSIEGYLDEYHELVVSDPAAAYEQAGPTLRGAIDLPGFEQFWGRFDDVNISDVQVADGGDSATAVMELRFTNGDRQVEQHRFDFVEEDGRLVLDRDTFVEMIQSGG